MYSLPFVRLGSSESVRHLELLTRVRIKSWPYFDLLLSSWLPWKYLAAAKYQNAWSADFQKLRAARFFFLRRQPQKKVMFSNMTLVARRSAFLCILGCFCYILNFSKKRCSSSHQITPLVHHDKRLQFHSFIPVLVFHLVLQVVQFLCTWHIVYNRWWNIDPSLIHCWSIVDQMLVHPWFNLYSNVQLRQQLKVLTLRL